MAAKTGNVSFKKPQLIKSTYAVGFPGLDTSTAWLHAYMYILPKPFQFIYEQGWIRRNILVSGENE